MLEAFLEIEEQTLYRDDRSPGLQHRHFCGCEDDMASNVNAYRSSPWVQLVPREPHTQSEKKELSGPEKEAFMLLKDLKSMLLGPLAGRQGRCILWFSTKTRRSYLPNARSFYPIRASEREIIIGMRYSDLELANTAAHVAAITCSRSTQLPWKSFFSSRFLPETV
jgi:hypothetical protein